MTLILIRSRRIIAGYLLLTMVVLSLVYQSGSYAAADWIPAFPFPLIGIIAFSAAFLLLPDVHQRQQLTVSALMILGLVLIWYSYQHGARFSWSDILSRNTALLCMLLSVSFLKLVTLAPEQAKAVRLPVGQRAFRDTLIAVSLFGSVINISAPLVIADRLTARTPLTFFSAQSLIRVFTACASWSPFFAGMAVVLTFVPAVDLAVVVVSGFPYMLSTLIIVYLLSLKFNRTAVNAFVGFPLKVNSLNIPVLLALTVVVLYALLPGFPILATIAIAAWLVTVVMLLIRAGAGQTAGILKNFVENELPKSVNELTLFLAAGVLATGLVGLVDIGFLQPPLTTFSFITAAQVLAFMILVAACGIHPVIQISALTPILAVLDPPANLLAVTYLFAWTLGTCASPLSGTNLVFQARYEVSAFRLSTSNWPFVCLMYFVAIFWLRIHYWVFG